MQPIALRFMRPGTRHMVLTVDDSFALGGHFYSKSTLTATLRSIVYEHYFGPYITNSGHLTSASILFRLVASYRRVIMNGQSVICACTLFAFSCTEANLVSPSHYSIVASLPTDNNMADLLVTVHYYDQLWPLLPSHHGLCGWKRECFVSDHSRAVLDATYIETNHPSSTFVSAVSIAESNFIALCNACADQIPGARILCMIYSECVSHPDIRTTTPEAG